MIVLLVYCAYIYISQYLHHTSHLSHISTSVSIFITHHTSLIYLHQSVSSSHITPLSYIYISQYLHHTSHLSHISTSVSIFITHHTSLIYLHQSVSSSHITPLSYIYISQYLHHTSHLSHISTSVSIFITHHTSLIYLQQSVSSSHITPLSFCPGYCGFSFVYPSVCLLIYAHLSHSVRVTAASALFILVSVSLFMYISRSLSGLLRLQPCLS